MTTDCDNDVKLSPKRQHSKITLSTGQDEESVVVVPGKRHKQGDTGHMLALDVQCLCQLHPKPITHISLMHQRQHQQFLATPLKQDADNDSGTRSTASYQIMRRSSWSALSIWMMEELSLTLMTHRQAIVSKYIIISLLCSY